MRKQIWFDMDGTIADLYGCAGWLDDLMNESTAPYENAKPIGKMQVLARYLNKAQRNGYTIGIVSWTCKNGGAEYCEAIAKAKKAWLKKHLKSVKWDMVDIIPYGEPKQNGRNGILFDDEKPNRENWIGQAYKETEIMEVLRGL